MSSYIGDLSQLYGSTTLTQSTSKSSSTSLDMTDFLQLMVAQFQNQTIDDTADTSDMLNQLVQMQMIEAITNITDATTMMYAGSLVGKEVTIGQYDSNGTLQETVGTVTGTGYSNGQQVVFVNDQSYTLSEIMAVGRLPSIQQSTAQAASAAEAET
jgi:flagellar basal-body rod modification protein FlgD